MNLGKGRPTPTRKEAEAARKQRVTVPRTRKEQLAAQRMEKAASSKELRAGYRNGDDKFLPPKDKGPVRRFVRDFVDARFTVLEILVPVMMGVLVLSYAGSAKAADIANLVLLTSVVLSVFDGVALRMRMRREVARRFPGEPLKGLTYYAVVRAMQMRFMRLPKSQVKVGQTLPETYR